MHDNNRNNNNSSSIIKKTKSHKEGIIAKSVFLALHLAIYLLLTFKSTTILNEAWRNGDYFYLIWTHCLFFLSLFSYLYASSKKPGFIPTRDELKLNCNSNNNSNNSHSNNSYSNISKRNNSFNDIDQELETFEGTLNSKKNKIIELKPLLEEEEQYNDTDKEIKLQQQQQEKEEEEEILYLQRQQDINEIDNINDILNNNNKKRRLSGNIKVEYHENTKIEKFYCKFCKIYVPLRSKHCSSCERCIYKFDHHCVFIGSCVGLDNHKAFWSFLLAEALLLALGFRIITSGYQYAPTIKDWLWTNSTIIPPTLLIVGGFCMPLALFCFHSYLILTNQTSWEFSKYNTINFLKVYAKRGLNPFNKGIWSNFKDFLLDLEKPSDWKLPSEDEFEKYLKKSAENANSFNIWNNKYYSCCG
ncbi:hypothetical protein CYY_008387 [Polysphondylium violaceum]|uniref:Palmitoyltransferase n=1 Tax=Polysphondylium violaceum TaxID=133409 RepID=A0A8J4PNG3_9MYCE|nr:hypothetical protein CYY_008387 [Polysphondylium violaceum]